MVKSPLVDVDRFKTSHTRGQLNVFTLYLAYVPDAITENDLRDYFSSYGNVKSVKICKKESTKNTYNYGWVEFNDKSSAERALVYSKHCICNRLIRIKAAHWRKQPITGQRRNGNSLKNICEIIIMGLCIFALIFAAFSCVEFYFGGAGGFSKI